VGGVCQAGTPPGCSGGDGCCPPGCGAATDSDCPACAARGAACAAGPDCCSGRCKPNGTCG
jgi:hypothetical protein